MDGREVILVIEVDQEVILVIGREKKDEHITIPIITMITKEGVNSCDCLLPSFDFFSVCPTLRTVSLKTVIVEEEMVTILEISEDHGTILTITTTAIESITIISSKDHQENLLSVL